MDAGNAGNAGAIASAPIPGHTLKIAPAFSGYRPSLGIKRAAMLLHSRPKDFTILGVGTT